MIGPKSASVNILTNIMSVLKTTISIHLWMQPVFNFLQGGLGEVWRLAPQSSVLIKELLQRLGVAVVEWYFFDHTFYDVKPLRTGKEMAKLDGPAWEHLLVCENSRDDDFK